MIRQTLLLACVVIPCMALLPPPDDILRKYAEKKAWKACIGDNLVDNWSLQVSQAVDQCQGFGGRSTFPPVNVPVFVTTAFPSSGIPTTFRPNNLVSTNTLRPSISRPFASRQQPVIFAILDNLPNGIGGRDSNFNRVQRQTGRLTANDLLEAEDKIRNRVSNFTCILSALDLIDSTGQIRFSKMGEDIASLSLDNSLKRDLLQVLNDCASLSSCLPPRKETSLLMPFELQKVVAFLKCTKANRQVACIKNDIRQYLLRGLPSNVKPTFNLEETVNRILQVKIAETEDRELSLLM